jgi:hypothetical protein
MDVDPFQTALETIQEVFEKIMGDGSRDGCAGHLKGNGLGFGGSDEYRQGTRIRGALEEEHKAHF